MTDRRTFLAAGGALALSACATTPLGSAEPTQVPAPRWSAGENWTYRRIDAYNGLDRGTVTRAVESVAETGLRVITRHANGAVSEDALFESPGIQISGTLSEDGYVAGTFAPRLLRYDFPLVSGKRWKQTLTCTDSDQSRYFLAASTRVEGWDEVVIGARAHRAIIIRRTLHLGPTPAHEGDLNREELEWYVPELRSGARLRIFEWEVFLTHVAPGYRLDLRLESYRLT